MTLFHEHAPDNFTPWRGEKINGISHPRNIGILKNNSGDFAWSDEALAAIDLYRPASADPIDVGFVQVSQSVQRVGGVVKYVNVTEAEPDPSTDPRDYELTPGQFEYLLVDTELDDALEAAKGSAKSARGTSPADKELEAQFKMALKGRSFNFDATLGLIASLAAHIPVGVNVDETYLAPFWLKAAAK